MKQADTINLFIINDDQLLIDALADEIHNVFAFYNITITSFNSGEDCSAFMKSKFSPDIVIVDQNLTKSAISSFALVDLVKTVNRNAETIMLAGDDNTEVSIKALEHGVHDYIVKNDFLFKKIRITMLQCIKVVQLRKNMKKQVSLGVLSLIVIFLMFSFIISAHYYVPATVDVSSTNKNNTHTNTENVITRQAHQPLHTGGELVDITTKSFSHN